MVTIGGKDYEFKTDGKSFIKNSFVELKPEEVKELFKKHGISEEKAELSGKDKKNGFIALYEKCNHYKFVKIELDK